MLLGFDRAAAIALALTVAVFLVSFWLIYAGESGGLQVHPPGTVRSMVVVEYAESRLSASGSPLFWVAASVVGILGFCGATLAGIPAALAGGELRRTRSTALLIALLIASLGPFLLLSHKGGSQNFFTYYGLCRRIDPLGPGARAAMGPRRGLCRRVPPGC